MKEKEDLEKLVALCKERNSDAQKKIFDIYKDSLFAMCLRYSKTNTEAEDMLMEGWIRIFNNIDSFMIYDYFKAPLFEAWIKKIMTNTAINIYNANKKYNKFKKYIDSSYFEDDELFENNYIFSEKELMSCLQKLSDRERIIFNMFAIDGDSYSEIGNALNINLDIVKMSLYRSRKKLKNELEKISKKRKNE